MIPQYGHVCRPVGDAPRLKVVRDKTVRSTKEREGARRTPGAYWDSLVQLRGPAGKGNLRPQIADLRNIDEHLRAGTELQETGSR